MTRSTRAARPAPFLGALLAILPILWVGACQRAGDGVGLDTSGKVVAFCVSHPDDPSCRAPVDSCQTVPPAPGCQVDVCKTNPSAPGCSVDVCTINPDDPSCKPVATKVRLAEVLPIFKEQCEQCHSPGGAGYGTGRLHLGADSAWANLVDKPAWVQTVAKGWVRVKPGQPDSSILWIKLSMATPKLPDGKTYGAAMPMSKPSLPAANLELIKQWISDGAIK